MALRSSLLFSTSRLSMMMVKTPLPAVATISARFLAVPRHANRLSEDWKKLNEKIKTTALDRESTLHDLLLLYDRENRHMGTVNVSSLFIYLANLARRRGQQDVAKHERFFDHLSRRAFDLLPEMSAASLADVALASSMLSITDLDFLERLWQHVEPKLAGEFEPKDLSKLIEALHRYQVHKTGGSSSGGRNPTFLPLSEEEAAKIPLPLDSFLPKIHSAATTKINDFLPHQLALVTKYLALLEAVPSKEGERKGKSSSSSSSSSPLFEAAEKFAVPRIHLFKSADMETLAWAFARSGRESQPLLEAIHHQGTLLKITFRDLKKETKQ